MGGPLTEKYFSSQLKLLNDINFSVLKENNMFKENKY